MRCRKRVIGCASHEGRVASTHRTLEFCGAASPRVPRGGKRVDRRWLCNRWLRDWPLLLAVCCLSLGVARAQTSSGNIVEFNYDAVGNIVGIQSSSVQLGLSGFSPSSGPIGTTVVVLGSGFGTTAASNTVKFNGVPAPVASGTRTQLTVTVPPTATTGPIAVTVGGSTVSSAASFVVTADYGPPTISSFTPTIGVAGTAVSVAGSNFNPTVANNSARVGVAAATVTSATSANVVVTTPSGTGSGHIQVTTPKGS